jgi:Na+/melibiose symporter-like transporter
MTRATTQYSRERKRAGKVPFSTKIFQGIGGLPGSHKDFAFNTFLLLYYSQILGLPASIASLILGICLLTDALTDPLVGAYSDNFKSRFGRRHPFMYAASAPLGLCMFALFSPPGDASETGLMIWMFVFVMLTRLAFTFFVVPWNALAAEFSEDYEERTSIITYRVMVTWIGGVTFIFAIYSLVFPTTEAYAAGQLNPAGYPLFAICLGATVSTWCILTTHLTRRETPYLLQPVAMTPIFNITDLVRQVMLALTLPNFRLLFIAVFLFAGIAGVGQVFDIYMNTYFWEFAGEDLRWFTLTIAGAAFAFVTLPVLQTRFQKHTILVWVLAALMLLAMIKVIFRFADIWPDNGETSLLVALVMHGSLSAYMITVSAVMFGSMVADLVDEQEAQVHLRQEGVFSSAIGFSAKATSSLGLIIGGFLLDFVVAFPRGTQPGEVESATLTTLAITDGIVIPILYFLPIYLLSRYTLTRDRLGEIQASLQRL